MKKPYRAPSVVLYVKAPDQDKPAQSITYNGVTYVPLRYTVAAHDS